MVVEEQEFQHVGQALAAVVDSMIANPPKTSGVFVAVKTPTKKALLLVIKGQILCFVGRCYGLEHSCTCSTVLCSSDRGAASLPKKGRYRNGLVGLVLIMVEEKRKWRYWCKKWS